MLIEAQIKPYIAHLRSIFGYVNSSKADSNDVCELDKQNSNVMSHHKLSFVIRDYEIIKMQPSLLGKHPEYSQKLY